jgi:anti-sigma28 factor (negative regulator of flagellin synthesis)
MKIYDRKLEIDPLLGVVAGARPRPPARASLTDRVDLSSTALALAGLRGELGAVDGVRSGRVAALRGAVASGTYGAPPADVARKVLRELLGELVS